MPSPMTWFTVALVAVDGIHHPLEHGVEELSCLLGVAVGEQLHRALEVGEEHGDLLVLAFQGRLGGEDLLGEVLRGIGLGRRSDASRRSGRANGLSALLAELRAGRQLGAVGPAREGQPAATLQAELGVAGILVPALRTAAHASSFSSASDRSSQYRMSISPNIVAAVVR